MYKSIGRTKVFMFLLLLVLQVMASSGDRSRFYNDCTAKCNKATCTNPPDMPISLQLTLWNCPQNCRYECMHQMTDISIQYGVRVQQFHGKWPFYRLMGIQEPASVLFSILNGIMHVYGLSRYKTRMGPTYSLRIFYIVHGYLAINSWVWSAIFHTRDFAFTEKMDYFSAMAVLLSGLVLSVHRIFGVTKGSLRSSWIISASVLFFIIHVSYLGFYMFDYKYI